MTRTAAIVGVGVAASALVLAGCSDDGTTATPTPTPTPTTTPTVEPTPEPVWPFTGSPVGADGADAAAVPALVVKIDNSAAAEPQRGLAEADLVVEQLVEGGMTRLAAVYHSTLPEIVEPVRSVRGTDIGIVAPTEGALVASGGAGRVLDDMADAGLTLLTNDAGDPGFSRDDSREAPYNVVLDPSAARAAAIEAGLEAPTQPYLPWGSGPPDGAEPVTTVTATFSGAHSSRWTWSGEAWELDDDRAGDSPFAPTTLVILRVTTRDAGYRDPGGNPVPETVLEGSGEAIVVTEGGAVRGTWAKDSPAAALTLTTTDGEPMTVPPGRTWIELVPDDGSVELR